MAHFARIQDGLVVDVVVVSNDMLVDDERNEVPFPESEPLGQAYLASLGLEGEWLQTSYNGVFRGAYAGAGSTYDSASDEFRASSMELST